MIESSQFFIWRYVPHIFSCRQEMLSVISYFDIFSANRIVYIIFLERWSIL